MTVYRPHQQANMRSRMESYTPREHDAAWGDGEPESYGDCEECEMPVLFSDAHVQEGYARVRHWHTRCFKAARERETTEENERES